MLAGFGTAILAGYGIGARLEFMLTSIAFAVGIASVPMIGMSIGAGRDRAGAADRLDRGRDLVRLGRRRSAPSSRSSRISGSISSPAIPACAPPAINICRPRRRCTPSSGWRSSMYFSSQGAAKVLGPVLAQTARLLFIAGGGWWLSTHDATAANFFTLAAASMVVLGMLSAQRGADAMGTEGGAVRRFVRRCPDGRGGPNRSRKQPC